MTETYEFDDAFQRKVAALAIRDTTFNIRTNGLVDPRYFDNVAQATLVGLVAGYYEKYKTTPSTTVLAKLIKDGVASKKIRSDLTGEIKEELVKILKADVSDRDYVIDEVASFARHQAIIGAMEKSVEHLDKRDFDGIERDMGKALQVAANDDNEGHDLYEDIKARSNRRKEIVAGVRKRAITSGHRRFDDATADGGFTRGELAVLLGPAKRGKSFGLMNFAVNAQLAKYNVLFVTLENSVDVTTNRIDAYLSGVETKKLNDHIDAVEEAVTAKLEGKGTLKIHQYPTKTFGPRDLERLIETYRAKGLIFDMIVVDYWDIMKPPVSYRDDSIRESAEIGIGLRAIAMREDVAVVTAIQSNRDGFKATTAKAEHAAEDFNKVRLADMLFSINATEDERSEGKARLFFAAVRNAEGGYELSIRQDLSRANFITRIEPRGGY